MLKRDFFLVTGTKSRFFGNRPLESNSDVPFQMLCTGKTFLKALEFPEACFKA